MFDKVLKCTSGIEQYEPLQGLYNPREGPNQAPHLAGKSLLVTGGSLPGRSILQGLTVHAWESHLANQRRASEVRKSESPNKS